MKFKDFFVTRLRPSGQLPFPTFTGGSPPFAYDTPTPVGFFFRAANSIAVDYAGNIYLTGIVGNESLPVVSAFQPRQAGISAPFVMKLDPPRQAHPLPHRCRRSRGESGRTIRVDSAGNAFVAGGTTSAGFSAQKRNPIHPREYRRPLRRPAWPRRHSRVRHVPRRRWRGRCASVRRRRLRNPAAHRPHRFPYLPLRASLWPAAQNPDVFYTRISRDGRLLYSTLLGGSELASLPDIPIAPNGDGVIGMATDSRDVTGADLSVPVPLPSNLAILRLTAVITAAPSQIALTKSTAAPALRFDTTPGLD